ncbi:S-layer homology domain-containing protein [Lysinibacillus sp. KU-BSD001]|uniref:S-layer homology domain-containing protein n=1 Tax=Lysinibacillus sp. KU-BSD001 TaxID=3141328 RepID=UPI0036E670B2
MKKWIVTVVLGLTLFFVPQLSSAKTFIDVTSNNPYYDMLDHLSDDGIISGYGDGQFKPDATMTRAHMAVMITRAYELEDVRPAVNFLDVPPTHPYYEAITKLYTAGIIDGSNGKFRPDEPLTRAQLAKVLTNVLGLEETQTTAFQDVPVHDSFNGFIGALVEAGITTGYGNETFRPNALVTRQHFAVFIYRALYNEEETGSEDEAEIEEDRLPISPVGTEAMQAYLDQLHSIETEYGLFYASPSISDAYLTAYAEAFTGEEVHDFAALFDVVVDEKPVFLVLAFEEDIEQYSNYGDVEGLDDAMGWVNFEENVIVLTTNLQEEEEYVNLELLGHEYFHWVVSNFYEVSFTTGWVEEALAENIGYTMQDNKDHFVQTDKFKEYIEYLLEIEQFGDITESYSAESVVAFALLESQFGMDKIEEFILLIPQFEDDEEAFIQVFNMSYEDLYAYIEAYLDALV